MEAQKVAAANPDIAARAYRHACTKEALHTGSANPAPIADIALAARSRRRTSRRLLGPYSEGACLDTTSFRDFS